MGAVSSLSKNRSKHLAVGGMAAVLEHLTQGERAALVNAVTGTHSIHRHWAIAELGKQWRHLTLLQREALVNAARQINDVGRKAEALAGLAEGGAKWLRESAPAS